MSIRMERERDTSSNRVFGLESALFAIIAIVLGIAFVAISQISTLRRIEWLPLRELGFAAMGTGTVAVVFEYLARRDWIRRIVEAVLRGFAASPQDLARLLSDNAVDAIAENSLALRLGNRALAAHIVRDVTTQVAQAQGRLRFDAVVSINLTPWTTPNGTNSFYMASVRCSYRTEAPLGEPQQFAVVSDADRYRQLLHEPNTIAAWIFAPHAGMTAASPEVFTLDRFDINGTAQPITHAATPNERTFTVHPEPDAAPAGELYTVAYEYRALLDRTSLGFRFDVAAITHRLNLNFTIYDPTVAAIDPLIHIPSYQAASVRTSRSTGTSTSATVTVETWIMPITGINFLWTRNHQVQSR